ncbi:MAG: hypothetical protein V1845_02740 [bacterium]
MDPRAISFKRIDDVSLEQVIGFILRFNGVAKFELIFYRTGRRLPRMEAYDDPERNYDRRVRMFRIGEDELGESFEATAKLCRKRKRENMGLVSLVRMDDEKIRHIPMIDFQCPCCEEGLTEAIRALDWLGQRKGFLLESGRSYHYYGINVMTADEWVSFMRDCRERHVIGSSWPMHQLEDGFSVLRISTSISKPQLPKVIGIIGHFVFEK